MNVSLFFFFFLLLLLLLLPPMHLLNLHLPLPFSHLHPPRPLSSSSSEGSLPPARDRVIDFGRHRGRRLGSLPSSYLRWVSSTLRARSSEPWALLADRVLRDPLYRDRIEWEHAARLLSGDAPLKPRSPSPSPSSSSGVDVVSELLGIAERFGWDNDDREGWARVDFELLGTSFGGRIPRIRRGSDSGGEKGRKVGSLGEDEEEADEVVKGKGEERRERRRRRRVKREKQEEGDRDSSSNSNGFVEEERKECLLGNDKNGSLYNPFPGRGALLEKIKRRGG